MSDFEEVRNLLFYVFRKIIKISCTKCLKIRLSVQIICCIFSIWAVIYYTMILNYGKVNTNIEDFVVLIKIKSTVFLLISII